MKRRRAADLYTMPGLGHGTYYYALPCYSQYGRLGCNSQKK
jgi:hypothetical protein